jgi:hypothetical protein
VILGNDYGPVEHYHSQKSEGVKPFDTLLFAGWSFPAYKVEFFQINADRQKTG